MIRNLLFVAAAVAVTLNCAAVFTCREVSAAERGTMISRTEAARHGLVRPWFAQVQLDRGRGRLTHVVLYDGIIYAQTNMALVQAIDAESGETKWIRRFGRSDHLSYKVAVERDLIAVINGSRLFVANRHNGDLLYETKVKGAPGAGPALSDKRVYVPMVQGLVMAYRLESLTDPEKELGFGKKWEEMNDEDRAGAEEYRRENLRLSQEYIPPLACQSLGKNSTPLLVTLQDEAYEQCAWPTDRGFLNIGRIKLRDEDRLEVLHQVPVDAGVPAQPAYKPADPEVEDSEGIIFAASKDGFVHAIAEKSGDSLWRFSTGEAISQPALIVADRVYVATRIGGLFCIDAKLGQELWWAPEVCQFVSASKERVYGVNKSGRIVVLDAKTGARLDAIATDAQSIKLANTRTDRIYLAGETGLIQCMHEVELPEPFDHVEWEAEQNKAAEEEANKIEQEGIDPVVDKPKQDAEESKDPFGGADDADAGDDPFGGAGGDDVGGDDAGGDDAGGGDADDPFGGDDPFSMLHRLAPIPA